MQHEPLTLEMLLLLLLCLASHWALLDVINYADINSANRNISRCVENDVDVIVIEVVVGVDAVLLLQFLQLLVFLNGFCL